MALQLGRGKVGAPAVVSIESRAGGTPRFFETLGEDAEDKEQVISHLRVRLVLCHRNRIRHDAHARGIESAFDKSVAHKPARRDNRVQMSLVHTLKSMHGRCRGEGQISRRSLPTAATPNHVPVSMPTAREAFGTAVVQRIARADELVVMRRQYARHAGLAERDEYRRAELMINVVYVRDVGS